MILVGYIAGRKEPSDAGKVLPAAIAGSEVSCACHSHAVSKFSQLAAFTWLQTSVRAWPSSGLRTAMSTQYDLSSRTIASYQKFLVPLLFFFPMSSVRASSADPSSLILARRILHPSSRSLLSCKFSPNR